MRKFLLASIFGLISSLAWAQPAPTPEITAIVCAQNAVLPSIAAGQFGLIQCDAFGRPYISPIGFTPLGAYATPVSVTTTSAANLLPSGASVTIYNTGTNPAYIKFGTTSSVTATIANDAIPAGGGCGFNIGANTYIAALTASSTTTLNLSGGSGLAPSCWGSSAASTGGSVTSVSFTGGLISVATPTTTPALTVAGTSGGIPYFSGASTWASSGVLAAGSLVTGGGAGTTPATITLGGDCTFSTPNITCLNTNGVAFGSLATLSAAPAGTLTGTTLNATVVTSSLTTVGTLGSLSVTGAFTAGQATISGNIAGLHFAGNGAAPTISGCGTGPSGSTGFSRVNGTITEGTTPTGCTLTFGAFTNAPNCIAQFDDAIPTVFTLTTTTTTLVITNTGGTKFTYHCFGS